jgi:hypothetical protein
MPFHEGESEMYEVTLYGGQTERIDADGLHIVADPGVPAPYFTLTKNGKTVFLATLALTLSVNVV